MRRFVALALVCIVAALAGHAFFEMSGPEQNARIAALGVAVILLGMSLAPRRDRR